VLYNHDLYVIAAAVKLVAEPAAKPNFFFGRRLIRRLTGLGTPISRALHAQTFHEHVGPWVVGNHIEFIFLRESSDGANPFISVTAIQLIPKLYYTSTSVQRLLQASFFWEGGFQPP